MMHLVHERSPAAVDGGRDAGGPGVDGAAGAVNPAGALPAGLSQGSNRLTYVLRQRFSYAYDAPVRDLDHRLIVVPPSQHGDQRRLKHSVTVTGVDARAVSRRDAAGNLVTRARVALVPERVEFLVEAVVERSGPGSDELLPASALTDPRMLLPTRLTEADESLRRLAGELAEADPVATAARYCDYVHETITYEFGATSIFTTAAEAHAGRRGVCQDSAHVMLALCRAAGRPARYVSGHLLGEGGTHAWVEVIVPDPAGARAVAFDPCNGRRAGLDYLTIATGRDYTDVAPTSGTYTGAAQGTLTASKQVDVAAG
ncbi:MAG TPA: transglutaminase family protein [Actinocrinis sp.]|nr:transglutaminase family protein [Actinocrinis sp.]